MLTVMPVIAGLMANDAHAVRAGWLPPANVRPVRALAGGLLALFGLSYFKTVSAQHAGRAGTAPAR